MEEAEENGSRPQEKPFEPAPEKKKRVQYCTFCKNHNIQSHKKDHICPFKQCNCSLCELQRRAQVSMRHQQRVWRHQKHKLAFGKFHDVTNVIMEKGQVCDKCRNHNKIVMKKNHQCPHNDCDCEYCNLTFKRRELMKHLQRVRRSKITIEKDIIPTLPEKRQEEKSEIDQASITQENKSQIIHLEQESPTPLSSLGYPEDQSCSSWSDDAWSSLSPATPTSGLKEDSFEEATTATNSSDTLKCPTPGPHSPPPLIPLTQNYHVHPNSYVSRSTLNLPPQLEIIPQTENYERQNLSPHLLCQRQHEDTQISFFPPQRVPQIPRPPSSHRHSLLEQGSREYYTLDTPSTSSAYITRHVSCNDHQHYKSKSSVKFGADPEDFYLRHCNWQSSSTESRTSNSGSPPPLMIPSRLYTNRPQESVYTNSAMEGKGMFYLYDMASHYNSPPNAYPQNLSIVKRIYRE